MSKVTFQISGPVLDWLIEEAQERIPGTNEISMILQWKEGSTEPTIKQVEKLSKKLSIPFGYFFLDNPPVEEIPLVEYRTLNSEDVPRPSRDLISTIYKMENIATWVREDLINQDSEPNTVVGCIKDPSDFNQVANKVRSILNIEENWYESVRTANNAFNFLRSKMNNLGIVVMMNSVVNLNNSRKLNIKEFRAFSMVDEYAPLIFINGSDSWNGRLFSMLHEFCHICIGINSLYNLGEFDNDGRVDKTEVLCNHVAAEIIAPEKHFTSAWIKTKSMFPNLYATVYKLSTKFNCSQFVIARRALDFGLIDRNTYGALVEILKSNMKVESNKGEGGGHFYNMLASRIDKYFFHRLVSSVESGTTTYTEAYRLTNTNKNTFAKLQEVMLYE